MTYGPPSRAVLRGRRRLAVGLAAGSLLLFGAGALASDFSGIDVLALGPLDGRAVVKLSDGTMRVLALGETVDGTRATLMQVLPDRIVLEDRIVADGNAEVRERVWIYKAAPGERSTVRRLSTTAPESPRLEAPRF